MASSSTKGSVRPTTKWVYDFAGGSRELRELRGGRGAGIAEMTRVLGRQMVPSGFTITREACVAYMRAREGWPAGLEDEVGAALAVLEQRAGRRFGDAEDSLLVAAIAGPREP